MQESIMEQIRSYFRQTKWNFEEQENAFLTGVSLEGHTPGAMILVIANERSFTMLTAPDVEIPEMMSPAVQTFANEVNNLTNIGCLYLDNEQKVLVFRVGIICADTVPTLQQIDDVVGYSVTMIQDIAESLHDMIKGKLSPEDAAFQAVQPE